VLLPSSQPHHEVSVQELGGGVELSPMALESYGGVLGELAIDNRAGVRLGPIRRAVDGGGRFRFALVSEGALFKYAISLIIYTCVLAPTTCTWT
jgi:hypothetical protein